MCVMCSERRNATRSGVISTKTCDRFLPRRCREPSGLGTDGSLVLLVAKDMGMMAGEASVGDISSFGDIVHPNSNCMKKQFLLLQ